MSIKVTIDCPFYQECLENGITEEKCLKCLMEDKDDPLLKVEVEWKNKQE